MEHVFAHTARTRRHGLLARLRQMTEIRRQRHKLLDLNDHLLKDIGLTPGEAREEANRPSWDVPTHWRR